VSVVLLFTVTLAPIAPIAPHDEFQVRAELQGLYDEISQVTQQLETASDVDLFHDLLYTSDWMFIGATGQGIRGGRSARRLCARSSHRVSIP
jgi:hypothetical protein